jgi:cytochrome c biogenesis protein CcmG, thiol:disulfide interchange protein DsbE
MPRHASRARTVGLVVAVVMLAALLPAQAPAAPRPAPTFTLELLDGKTLSLAEYKGSPVILLFWAPW